MRHRGQVHDLLDATLGEHREAGLTARHDDGMVAEDVERVRGTRAGAHMEDAREPFGGDLVHVRDHEEQTLRCGVGGGEGACGKRTVDGARGAAFGLHLAHFDGGAEDVLLPLGGPHVHEVGHRARRGDRVNARHLSKRIGDVRGGVVAVHRFEFSRHRSSPHQATPARKPRAVRCTPTIVTAGHRLSPEGATQPAELLGERMPKRESAQIDSAFEPDAGRIDDAARALRQSLVSSSFFTNTLF